MEGFFTFASAPYALVRAVTPLFFLSQSDHLKNFADDSDFPLAGARFADYEGAYQRHAPFVYRLGRQIFILKRGVRLP